MSALPLIIVVGGDALALRICEELCGTEGHRVALLWEHDHDLAARVERMGAAHMPFPPNDFDALRAAGVMHATSLMALAEDDRLNLQVSAQGARPQPEDPDRACANSTGPSGARSSRTCPTVRFFRSRHIRLPPSRPRRSIAIVSTGCSSPIWTGRWSVSPSGPRASSASGARRSPTRSASCKRGSSASTGRRRSCRGANCRPPTGSSSSGAWRSSKPAACTRSSRTNRAAAGSAPNSPRGGSGARGNGPTRSSRASCSPRPHSSSRPPCSSVLP